MNRLIPCTIKFNNYLVIMEKKTDTEKVNSYEQPFIDNSHDKRLN